MPIERRKIAASLLGKGFEEKESSHHKYYHHKTEGRLTGSYTYVSRGTGYKTYSDNLLNGMKKTLKLDTLKQVKRLLECPMDGDEYNSILREKCIF